MIGVDELIESKNLDIATEKRPSESSTSAASVGAPAMRDASGQHRRSWTTAVPRLSTATPPRIRDQVNTDLEDATVYFSAFALGGSS